MDKNTLKTAFYLNSWGMVKGINNSTLKGSSLNRCNTRLKPIEKYSRKFESDFKIYGKGSVIYLPRTYIRDLVTCIPDKPRFCEQFKYLDVTVLNSSITPVNQPYEKAEKLFSVSKRSKSVLKEKIIAYLGVNKNNSLMTITFNKKSEPNVYLKVLNQFFTRIRQDLKKKNKIFSYIWVSEKTEKNVVHFHVLINQFLDVKKYNEILLKIQSKNGFKYKTIIDKKKMKIIGSPLDITKSKIKGDQVIRYLTSYLTKSDFNYVRRWHCSRDVSKYYTKSIILIDHNIVLKNHHWKQFRKNGVEFFVFKLKNEYKFLRTMLNYANKCVSMFVNEGKKVTNELINLELYAKFPKIHER